MSDALQSSSSPSSSISLPSSSSSTTSTFTTPSLPHLLHPLSPSSAPTPPLVASIQAILTEFQRVDSERAALVSRLTQLEQQAKERDDEVRLLKKQVEVLQYGVRCERAMRMGEGSRGRGVNGVSGGSRGKENVLASMREEKKAAGELADEKEQLLLKSDSSLGQPAAAAVKGRTKSKATPLQPNYFTLPSRLPASPMSARTMLMWRDYIQTEGSKLDLDLAALKEGKGGEDETDGKQSGRPFIFPPISPSQAAAALARPRSPGLSSNEATSAASTPRAGILGGKAKAGMKKVKKLQFKEEVERLDTGVEGEEGDNGGEEKERKSITSIFTPPIAADDKDSSSTPTSLASPASSSASPSPRTASSSSPSSSSTSKSVFSTLASSAAYKQLRPKLTLRHHVAGVRAITFDSSASLSTSAPSLLASASDDCTVQVWNLSAQLPSAGSTSSSSSSIAAKKQAAKPIEPITTFRHTHPVLSVALHVESSRLVAGTVSGRIEVWEATTTGVAGGLYGASVGWAGKLGGWQAGGAVWSVVMEESGDVVVCASADGNVYVYSMTAIGSAPLHTIPPPAASSRPTSLTYLSSEQLVAAYTGGELALIDVSTGTVVTRSTTASYITSVTANAFYLFTGHADGTIQLHDPRSLAPSSSAVRAHTDSVTSVSCHPTSSVLASCGHDETVRVWDVRDGGMRVLQCLEPHATHRSVMDEAVHCVRWNEDGRLASSGADGMVKVYV